MRKWLGQHREELKTDCYVSTILTAYTTRQDIKRLQIFESSKKSLIKNNMDLYRLFKDNLEQFFNYLKSNTFRHICIRTTGERVEELGWI